jgi:hypothetical protein
MEALGGQIWLQSPPGTGTAMQIVIPLSGPGTPGPPTGGCQLTPIRLAAVQTAGAAPRRPARAEASSVADAATISSEHMYQIAEKQYPHSPCRLGAVGTGVLPQGLLRTEHAVLGVCRT